MNWDWYVFFISTTTSSFFMMFCCNKLLFNSALKLQSLVLNSAVQCINHLSVKLTVTLTPWYVSTRACPVPDTRSNVKGSSVTPTPSFPEGRSFSQAPNIKTQWAHQALQASVMALTNQHCRLAGGGGRVEAVWHGENFLTRYFPIKI